MTSLNEGTITNLPDKITATECKEITRTKVWNAPNGKAIPVKLNGVEQLTYESPGRTYTNDYGEVKCQGEIFNQGDIHATNVVVSHTYTLTLSFENFVIGPEKVKAVTAGIILPCQGDEGSCRTPTATYVWDYDRAWCNLHYVKEMQGLMITLKDDAPHEVFMSTDGNLVRLISEGKISACGSVVLRTNYDKIFLLEGQSDKSFQKTKIHPADIDLFTYINNRDDYLYNNVLDHVEDELNNVLQYYCEDRIKKHGPTGTALQSTKEGFATYNLGNGTFATQAGEAIWEYQCRPVVVTPRTASKCYLNLPVHYKAILGAGRPNHTQFYLAPISRLIVTEGIPVECNDKFVGKYETMDKSWIMATPALHETSSPSFAHAVDHRKIHFDHRIDWSKGGIYSAKEIRSLQKYLEFSRFKEAVGYQLTSQFQSGSRSLDGSIEPRQLFPQVPSLNLLTGGIIARFLDILHTTGEFTSLLVGAYIVWTLLRQLVTYAYRIFVLKEAHGCSSHMLLCCFPDFLMFRKYRADYQAVHRGNKPPDDPDQPDVPNPVDSPQKNPKTATAPGSTDSGLYSSLAFSAAGQRLENPLFSRPTPS